MMDLKQLAEINSTVEMLNTWREIVEAFNEGNVVSVAIGNAGYCEYEIVDEDSQTPTSINDFVAAFAVERCKVLEASLLKLGIDPTFIPDDEEESGEEKADEDERAQEAFPGPPETVAG